MTQIIFNPSCKSYAQTRNLIIVCAGDKSLHYTKRWFGKTRQYLLCVIYYGTDVKVRNKFCETSDIFFQMTGPKWTLIRLFLINTSFWKGCKFIAIPDDDLDISVSKLNKLFSYGKKYKLDLYQPSLVNNGPNYISYQLLVHNPNCKLRYTNFIEIMTPFFSQKAFSKFIDLLTDEKIKSGWGIDFIMAKRLKYKKMAVIDAITVVHTKPLGMSKNALNSSFYKKFNINPYKELAYFLKKYHTKKFKPKTLKCVK